MIRNKGKHSRVTLGKQLCNITPGSMSLILRATMGCWSCVLNGTLRLYDMGCWSCVLSRTLRHYDSSYFTCKYLAVSDKLLLCHNFLFFFFSGMVSNISCNCNCLREGRMSSQNVLIKCHPKARGRGGSPGLLKEDAAQKPAVCIPIPCFTKGWRGMGASGVGKRGAGNPEANCLYTTLMSL